MESFAAASSYMILVCGLFMNQEGRTDTSAPLSTRNASPVDFSLMNNRGDFPAKPKVCSTAFTVLSSRFPSYNIYNLGCIGILGP